MALSPYRPTSYEDTDYCFKVREKGYRVYHQPESVAIHLEGGAARSGFPRGNKGRQVVNRAKFVERWSHVLKRQPPPLSHFDADTWHALAVRDEQDDLGDR